MLSLPSASRSLLVPEVTKVVISECKVCVRVPIVVWGLSGHQQLAVTKSKPKWPNAGIKIHYVENLKVHYLGGNSISV
jgi:hypothetical protein